MRPGMSQVEPRLVLRDIVKSRASEGSEKNPHEELFEPFTRHVGATRPSQNEPAARQKRRSRLFPGHEVVDEAARTACRRTDAGALLGLSACSRDVQAMSPQQLRRASS